MNSIFDSATRAGILDRLDRLPADRRPGWGKMNVNQMVVHCTGGIRMLIGEMEVAPKPGPLRNPLLRYLVIRVLPWPHGAPTAPELIPPADPGDFRENLAHLRAAIGRIGTRDPQGPFSPHPAFGLLRGDLLGALVARHLDHHLRQFGA